MSELTVDLQDREIVVTRGDFLAAFLKMPQQPELFITRATVPPKSSVAAIDEFRAQAFRAAMDKARELGWII